VGAAIIAAMAVVAVLAPLLSPYDASAITGDSLETPSAAHLLGTNDIGQDILSQLVSGTRSSVVVAVAAGGLAVTVAVVVGTASGLVGGWVDAVTMRVLDLLLAIPPCPCWCWWPPWPAPAG
jgi:ABC-type dipeptide/oligopeptide/nickel transport system permease subunit